MRAALLLTALCAALAAPAVAQTPAASRATLADASRAPSRATIIDGANWRCEGASCVATRGADQPAARACRRVVARFGPVTEFAWKGVVLSPAELHACNS